MGLIEKAITAIRRVGIWNTLRFIRYAQKRDRLERQAGCWDIQTGPPQAPGRLQSSHPVQSGAIFCFERRSLEVVFLAEDLVRLSWEPGKEPVPYGLAQMDWPPVQVDLIQAGDRVQIKSSRLTLNVENDGSLQYFDQDGCLLHMDRPPEWSERRGSKTGSTPLDPCWVLRSPLEPEAAIYGLGLRAFPLNLRGRDCRIWNMDPPGGYGPGVDPLYCCIPVYLSVHNSGSCLLFFENSYPGVFSFPEPDLHENGFLNPGTSRAGVEVQFDGGMLRYYFIPGPPDRALERYSQLTGRAPLPPRWSLGFHQSRWGYQCEADIREVAAGFQEHQLPLSAIHLDIDYMQGFRVFTVDAGRFPDLSSLAADLARQDIRIVTILDPGVKVDPGYALYKEGLEEGFFCSLPGQGTVQAQVWPGWSVFPDFTNPRVRKWWASQYAALLSQGVTGIWHDMNEPASFAAWGDFTLPAPTKHDLEGRSGSHLEAHNLYGLAMDRAGYEALNEFRPGARPWLLSRSGWAGVSRYAWSWTGDLETSWAALRQTISTLLGMGLSGIPFSGSDIGGFLGHPEPELFLRWFQMAVFTPFFRTHSTKEVPPREPWRFGDLVLSITGDFLRLRYRLLPYLYTLAWEASQTGWPLVRPLFWPDEKDPGLWEVEDAFLLGSTFLVAPVLEPGINSRKVSLPAGDWFDFWEDTLYRGPGPVEFPVCLERIPILVRAGSVVPMEEAGILQLHFYPDQNGECQGVLYTDAGDGYGPWRADRFASTRVGDGIQITRREVGQFAFPYETIHIYLHGMGLNQAWVDGKEAGLRGGVLETSAFEQVMLFGETS
jgi:alpha-glucosidase